MMTMTTSLQITLLVIICSTLTLVNAHGRLIDPPSRATAWRYGFDTPIDYGDNEGFCGGLTHQYEVCDGKCGICGDPWDTDPREHELGGLYATGTIVDTYNSGQEMQVTVQITANHMGHFEFKICQITDPEKEATQECLDRTPLIPVGQTDFIVPINSTIGNHTALLQLPEDLRCSHCVLQWRYVTGNTWGTCENGTDAMGCGNQEEFRACADIQIGENSFSGIAKPAETARRPEQGHGTPEKPNVDSTDDFPSKEVKEVSKEDVSGDTGPSSLTPHSKSSGKLCVAHGLWRNVSGMSAWCSKNCNHTPSFCPPSHCRCY